MTSPVDQRAAVIKAVKEAHQILSERHLMSSFNLAQLERNILGLSDLDRGKVSPLTRPAPQGRLGRAKRDSEELLLIAAARALCIIYAKNFKATTSYGDVAEMLHFRGYRLRNGSRISAETVRGWKNVKNPRVLALTEQMIARATDSPGEQARKILRFIGMRVTGSVPPKSRMSRQKHAN